MAHCYGMKIKLMERITILRLLLHVILLFTLEEFFTFNDAGMIGCLESDRRALLDLKSGLEDPENRLLSWRGSNCCQWLGISCENNTGAVTAVDLHNPYPSGYNFSGRYGFWNLSGKIRPSLTKMKSLRLLDLSFNSFNGIPVPDFLGSLENLEYLNLSYAGFVGLIPPSLGNLSNLQYLDVEGDWGFSLVVHDLEWVTGLVSLKHLVMNGVNLSSVGSDWIRILNRLPLLTELRMSSCGLSGPIPSLNSINLTSLAVVDLSDNGFVSKIPVWIVNISSLVYLDLSFCSLYGRIPLGFAELPNLQFLDLGWNYNLTANCSQLLRGRWEKLKVLDFTQNKLHGNLPASIGNLTFLTHFDLSYNDIQGGIPSSILKLCNLEVFRMTFNNLTGTLPQFPIETGNYLSRCPLTSMQQLDLSFNQLVGELPAWLGQLENLAVLGLEDNLLYGPIPASLGSLQNLSYLGLGRNRLNGTLPSSLGQLSKLWHFDVSSNHLSGIVTETHFLKQVRLMDLFMSSNSFLFNISSNWFPPFQVSRLKLGSCHLGPSFPAWIRFQKELEILDFSNASISGFIPFWFWEVSHGLGVLNVSFNQLHGQLPSPFNTTLSAIVDFSYNLFEGPIPLPIVNIEALDLSNNKLSGPIPENISASLPCIIFLSLSANQIKGNIPKTIGNMWCLKVIDLSSNYLAGSIPSSIGNCSYLKALDLSKNNLSGNIPDYFGQLSVLQTLHLSGNKLSGRIPSSFQNLSSLETLDLGNNRFTGRIPQWIGKGFENLRILSLRSNALSGELPSTLSNLSSLQVLDLADNHFNGSIPASFGDFKAMTQVQIVNQYLYYGNYRDLVYYKESLVVNIKGQEVIYTKTLSLVISLDLSGNILSGELPEEITKLLGLVALNLSRNQISGQIPASISKLRQLLSLDLSSNKMSGPIPESLSSLSFLGLLNLSNNGYSGMIPFTGHMMTFDASSFAGNPGLCGAPLVVKCSCDDDCSNEGRVFDDNSIDDNLIDEWFYLSVGLGFAAGLLVPYLMFALRRSWSHAYFGFMDYIIERIPW